ncbi:CU044_2847 family protein [Streptomyces sp. FIT100]|uniref:CU044_2847 family protein n=1 Tax=Streptomyces sp. FIT100 TaxID=2837956 RepID=UPI0021C66912|nr:CU044_2847 family protein [Streptomyces sp. FIT100]
MTEGDNRVENRVERILLPDGTPVWARISGTEELPVPASGPVAPPGGGVSFTDTGFADRVTAQMESLHDLVGGVARSIGGALGSVSPDEVSVEFGIELTAKAGRVVGLLADGEAKGAIKVVLTWQGGPPPGPAPADPRAAAGGAGVPAADGNSAAAAAPVVPRPTSTHADTDARSGSATWTPPGGEGAVRPS